MQCALSTRRPRLRERPGDRGPWPRILRAALLALFLLLGALIPPAAPASADNAATGSRSFEQRAAAEKATRSRYRRLEVASLVLIVACGGAAILWAVRRR